MSFSEEYFCLFSLVFWGWSNVLYTQIISFFHSSHAYLKVIRNLFVLMLPKLETCHIRHWHCILHHLHHGKYHFILFFYSKFWWRSTFTSIGVPLRKSCFVTCSLALCIPILVFSWASLSLLQKHIFRKKEFPLCSNVASLWLRKHCGQGQSVFDFQDMQLKQNVCHTADLAPLVLYSQLSKRTYFLMCFPVQLHPKV